MTSACISSVMSCQHCATAITSEIASLPGVQHVTSNPGSTRVSCGATVA